MKRVFADADYLIALLNPKEQLHKKAKAVSQGLGAIRMVTSQMVLNEVLAFYADKGPDLRRAATELVLKFGNAFSFEISDDAAESVLTVGAAVKLLERNAIH